MGTWSVGTDGGGSVRIPAAFTGTVALKPTYGLVPMYPPSPFGTLVARRPDDPHRHRRRAAARHHRRLRLAGLVGAAPPAASRSSTGSRTASRPAGRVLAAPRLRTQRPRGRGRGAGRRRGARRRRAPTSSRSTPASPTRVDAFHVLWFAGAAKVLERPTARTRSSGSTRGCARRIGDVRRRRHARRTTSTPRRCGWTSGVRMGAFHETLRPAADADHADPGVRGRARTRPTAGRRDAVDHLDAVHLPVQHDPAAGAVGALRVHRRPAPDRAAGRRAPARRRAGAAGRPRLRAR